MTVVAAMLDPPRDGLVLPDLPGSSPLSADESTRLYRAMSADVLRAVEASGGDLLVNYRPEELLPEEFRNGDADPEAEVRALAAEALADPADARFEVQVGSTFAARAGNTATHLLEREDASTVALVEGNAPLLSRKQIDSAAMRLRRSPAIFGPSTGGRVYYAAFMEPVDFTDAYDPPELESLTGAALDAGLDVDFLETVPVVETGDDLLTLVATIRARGAAGRIVPAFTTAFVEESGLYVVEEDGERRVVR